MTLDEVRQGLEECLGGDRVTALDMATYYPEYFWNIRLAATDGGSVEDFLEKNAMKKNKR
jgi:hypothetical protein